MASNSIIHNGHRFTLSRKAVTLPSDGTAYIKFGYAEWGATDDQGGKLVKTDWTMQSNGTPVYAKPIPLEGHSLTCMAYGKNGYAFLARDGRVYVSNTKNWKR